MKFECPNCGQHLSATSDQIGQTAPCPRCNKPVTVPDSVPLISQASTRSTTRPAHEGQNPQAPIQPKITRRNSQTVGWKTLVGLGIIIYIVYRLLSGGSDNTSLQSNGSSASSASSNSSVSVSDISWDTVNDIYNLKSSYTDLQKDEEWKRFKGKRVTWTGRISSISQSFGSLTMQVKMNPDTLTSDVIVTLRNSERSKAERLHQGDTVTFVATLNRWGTLLPISMNDGEIVQ
jgi:hypothetical protein